MMASDPDPRHLPARFAAGISIAFLVHACAVAPVSPDRSLPTLRVRTGAVVVPVVRGSYCWAGNGMGICADAISPPLLAEALDPPAVPAGASLELHFDPSPNEGSVQVERWEETGPVPVDGTNRVPAPTSAGDYVFSVMARWPQGDVTHVFRFEVASGLTGARSPHGGERDDGPR